jgi:5-methylcytosine-specific restriction endonuclease McrA
MYDDLPSTPAAAKLLGLKRYFTGSPCNAGHLVPRYVANCVCVECNSLKARRWQKENPEENRRYARETRQRHPEQAKITARNTRLKTEARNPNHNKERYAREADKRKVRASDYYRRETEKVKESNRRWQFANRDCVKVYNANRRARKLAIEGEGVTSVQVKALAVKQPQCPNCQRFFSEHLRYTLDHIQPLARGGKHSIDNIELLCKPCNSRKSWKDPIDHAIAIGRI